MYTFSYTAVVLLIITSNIQGKRLSQYVSHYEPVTYDHQHLAQSHDRAKRSVTNSDSNVHVTFKAHGHHFRLRLRRDTETFSNAMEVLDSSGNLIHPNNVDTSHIYHGHIVDEANSIVFGSIIDGVFEGKIISPKKGNYYIEKSRKYTHPHGHLKDSDDFHSVIYKENDVDNPYHNSSSHFSGCGVTGSTKQNMESIQYSGSPWNIQQQDEERPAYKYTRQAADKYHNGPVRTKRATKPKEERNTCSLFIQTDPLLWKHIKEQVGYDKTKTREEILSLIAHHVTAVNYIYRDTKFDGRIEHRNIKFEVQRIKIDDDEPCDHKWSGEQNPFCMENIDVSNFLNLHSLGNHEDFCLAYVFTYRDFTGGTLGLAWVASASGASGGICEKYKTYTETIGGLYQSTKRSLNTGIITFVNYNSRVPPKVSQLTLAHEIGHNFGSPHDYPSDCRPGGLSGNYIMFASATSGDRPNNSKFSSCSIANISSVLDAIQDNKKRNCFKASEGAFCGNKIVENGEECDCGYDDDECDDKCCYPRQVADRDRFRNISARGCARRAQTECSPSQGPCCYADTCRFIPSNRLVMCRGEDVCSYSSYCDGTTPECPVPPPKPNKTRCNEGTQLCINGDCTGSICLEWGLNECFLTSQIIPNIDKRKLCELACMNGTDLQTCRSTSEFASAVNLPLGGISLRPGSPCDNFQGYCDVFYKCRAVDAEGPLARLKNMLLNKQTLQTLQQWALENWWACMLMGVTFVIIMGVFIKCCAVHTPSSNPKKTPARRFSETLRRPITTLRRMRHNPQTYVSQPRSSRVPAHGYGEGRGHYYAPRASAPPAHGHSDRRNAFPMRHQPQHKV
ncbi:disintegrin and metalloproteinase domain-containing protein 10 isoform X1 [Rhopalosiphum padi]|uniref:disintegrin and metalloproteinase domain-containing protein 10 isoform X1 n=1 Tax=Rhopalosiphum padi TaxID=40932 RepID=UPI00298DCE50|nr:disintegrin and metalloproteinase domain-containing protein 10 isoform X1 [Rhopalosiphum padi]